MNDKEMAVHRCNLEARLLWACTFLYLTWVNQLEESAEEAFSAVHEMEEILAERIPWAGSLYLLLNSSRYSHPSRIICPARSHTGKNILMRLSLLYLIFC